jgi:hypothetical protein
MMRIFPLPMTLPRLALLVVAAVGLMRSAAPLYAAEETGCAAFLWPIAKEQAAFARPDLPVVTSGAAHGPWSVEAFVLKLKPQVEAHLPTPPSAKPMKAVAKPFAGFVLFQAPAQAAVYHVTLSKPAWIDVVQKGAPVPAAAFTGAHNCPSVHKSVRFELTKAPIVLEISGADVDTIKIAIVPAVD